MENAQHWKPCQVDGSLLHRRWYTSKYYPVDVEQRIIYLDPQPTAGKCSIMQRYSGQPIGVKGSRIADHPLYRTFTVLEYHEEYPGVPCPTCDGTTTHIYMAPPEDEAEAAERKRRMQGHDRCHVCRTFGSFRN